MQWITSLCVIRVSLVCTVEFRETYLGRHLANFRVCMLTSKHIYCYWWDVEEGSETSMIIRFLPMCNLTIFTKTIFPGITCSHATKWSGYSSKFWIHGVHCNWRGLIDGINTGESPLPNKIRIQFCSYFTELKMCDLCHSWEYNCCPRVVRDRENGKEIVLNHQARFKRNMVGCYQISTTAILQQSEIVARLDADVRVSASNSYIIKIITLKNTCRYFRFSILGETEICISSNI